MGATFQLAVDVLEGSAWTPVEAGSDVRDLKDGLLCYWCSCNGSQAEHVVVDSNGTAAYVNGAYREVLGYAPASQATVGDLRSFPWSEHYIRESDEDAVECSPVFEWLYGDELSALVATYGPDGVRITWTFTH